MRRITNQRDQAQAELWMVHTRGGRTESDHGVSVAVVDVHGRLVAQAGDPHRATYWRSAAKPFQAVACVRDGAAAGAGFGLEELALACASHSSEPRHVALARRMLEAIACTEDHLACGPHPPLAPKVHDQLICAGTTPTPAMSNCSGKHAAMLALARHHGWALEGYAQAGHPVQERILADIAAFTGLSAQSIGTAGDGCRAVTFYVPLNHMARAWAQLGAAQDSALHTLRQAMTTHPDLVAGADRACTTFIASTQGGVLAKVGAEGVYCAALPERGLGIALKVHSGDWRATPAALAAVLFDLDDRLGLSLPHDAWISWARPALLDTRGEHVGHVERRGALGFR